MMTEVPGAASEKFVLSAERNALPWHNRTPVAFMGVISEIPYSADQLETADADQFSGIVTSVKGYRTHGSRPSDA
jgi:hypothetical protein